MDEQANQGGARGRMFRLRQLIGLAEIGLAFLIVGYVAITAIRAVWARWVRP